MPEDELVIKDTDHKLSVTLVLPCFSVQRTVITLHAFMDAIERYNLHDIERYGLDLSEDDKKYLQEDINRLTIQLSSAIHRRIF
jgi:hypothetical protein